MRSILYRYALYTQYSGVECLLKGDRLDIWASFCLLSLLAVFHLAANCLDCLSSVVSFLVLPGLPGFLMTCDFYMYLVMSRLCCFGQLFLVKSHFVCLVCSVCILRLYCLVKCCLVCPFSFKLVMSYIVCIVSFFSSLVFSRLVLSCRVFALYSLTLSCHVSSLSPPDLSCRVFS